MDNPEHQSSYDSEKSENIDLNDSSSNMNEDEQALFLNITKSRSNDSFLGKLIGTAQDIQKRPLVLNMSEFCSPNQQQNQNQNGAMSFPPTLSIFKKVIKQKKHNKCDYQKNICGYIMKKIIREFIGPTFEDYVEHICHKYYCSSDEARKYYLSKVEYVTGPSHIPLLLQPQINEPQQVTSTKFAFRQFFQWFLKQRYLRYLLLEGKMSDKKAYIEEKNNVLFPFLEENRAEIDKRIKHFIHEKQTEKRLQQQMLKIKTFTARSKSRDRNIILTQRLQ